MTVDQMTVYFVKWEPDRKMIERCMTLYDAAGVFDVVEKGDLVAIKLHVGEYGNPTHIKPAYVREIANRVRDRGGKPFLTDTCTLYRNRRHNAVDHMETAMAHGFGDVSPFVVADGLQSENGVAVPTKGIFENVEVAGALAEADAMIVVTHVKGHGAAGMGGAIKNLGMGGTTREGKRAQHRSVGLEVIAENCQGCGNCVDSCIMDAITIVDEKVHVDDDNCMCCGFCVDECENDALRQKDPSAIMRALASATYGVLSTFDPDKVSYVSFATNITLFCDCAPNPGEIVHPDIGVYASKSPVSIDAAVMKEIGKLFEKKHGLDATEQVKELKDLGVEGDLDPKIQNL
jgi:uncharacterized Fe-S center protein